MLIRILLDRPVWLSYHTITVGDAEVEGGPGGEPWRGQLNGLCGAAVPGWLSLTTGVHTGVVPLRIEVHSDEPPIGDGWEEVVEASFEPAWDEIAVTGLMGDAWPIALPAGSHRVRYCASGMQQGRERDTGLLADLVDSYLLQFWPAEPASDRILRQTSAIAAYWHQHHPTPAPTTEQNAARHQAARVKAEPAGAETQRNRTPGARLRAAGRRANSLQWLDAALPPALAELDDDTLRVIALWAAGQAAAVAGITGLPWVAETLRTGRPPAPFDPELDYQAAVWAILDSVPITTVRLRRLTRSDQPVSQQHVALPALFAITGPDPLTAALEAVGAAASAHGDDNQEFLSSLRREFPQLNRRS